MTYVNFRGIRRFPYIEYSNFTFPATKVRLKLKPTSPDWGCLGKHKTHIVPRFDNEVIHDTLL